jgi:two-component system response regulator ChvI
LKKGLELEGFTVDIYNDPQAALDSFKPDTYDQIILDIRMPGMTGFELARAIWAQDPQARVCFLSSFEIYDYEAKKVFSDLNSTCFVKKPLTPTALAVHIQTHLAPT